MGVYNEINNKESKVVVKMLDSKLESKVKLLIVVNVDWFFLSHRLPLALEALKNKWEVSVACADTGRSQEIIDHGVNFYKIPFSRSGTNILSELKTISSLYKVYKKVKPDVIHQVTLKPVVYGSLISRLLKVKGTVNAISGMGYNFTEGRQGIVQKMMIRLMKIGFKQDNLGVIFQNEDDLKQVQALDVTTNKTKLFLVKGSGVDLRKFTYSQPIKKDKLIVLLPARMLYDKGVKEFKEASNLLLNEYKDKVSFLLAGLSDKENKAGVSEEVLNSWYTKGYFEWVGYQKDIISLYKNADIVVLPSYREGLPKSLIEACAIGRPIITTNAIGCKECVNEGVNGFKVPVKSINELAEAISKLLGSEELRVSMGKASRKKAEEEFSLAYVVNEHLSIYSQLYER